MNWTTELPTKPGYYWIRNYTINAYPNKPEWNQKETGPYIGEVKEDWAVWCAKCGRKSDEAPDETGAIQNWNEGRVTRG